MTASHHCHEFTHSPKRILIVDDDRDFAESIADVLALKGYQVKSANCKATAVSTAADFKPHVALLDIKLGSENGIDLIVELKQILPSILCIMQTAYSSQEYAIASLQQGAFDYINKPCHPEDILARLDRCFDRLALESSRFEALQALEDSELRNRTILETAGDAIIATDEHGIIETLNPAAHQIFQRSKDELLGTFLDHLIFNFNITDFFSNGENIVQGEFMAQASNRTFPVAIKASRTQLQFRKLLIFIICDITERKAAENAIKQLNVQLEQRVEQRTRELTTANKEMQTFCYSVSHDLRAPLRAIDGFSLALLEEEAQNLTPTGKQHLQRVRAASQRMSHLIDALLMLSRVSQNQLNAKTVDLSLLAHQSIQTLMADSGTNNISVNIASKLLVLGDYYLLQILIDNLLSNAWKFTNNVPHASIELGVTRDNSNAAIYFVRDNGVGFDMQYADKLFQAFQRLHTEPQYEGTGIGLATARRIVQRHQGKIWIESEPGKGTCVRFTLNYNIGSNNINNTSQPASKQAPSSEPQL